MEARAKARAFSVWRRSLTRVSLPALPCRRMPLAMNPLPSALAAPAVAALNHLLEQEPWARGQLVPFAGA